MSILLLVLGLVLFISLIVTHEFGHFIMAKRNGVKVEEFGIFFPPRLFKRKTKEGWIFTINLLPLGGFVRLKGEHDSDTEPGSFGAASLAAKCKIMIAGVVVNLLTAIVLFTMLALVGMPKLIENQFNVKSDTHTSSTKILITQVEANSPAAKAGLKGDDEINSIGLPGKTPIAAVSSNNLPNITKEFAGQKVDIAYSRAGHNYTTTATLLSAGVVNASQANYDKQIKQSSLNCSNIALPKGYLGISPTDYVIQKSTWSAPVTAVGMSVQMTGLLFQGLGHALGGLGSLVAGAVTGNTTARQNGQCSATSSVGGPVFIYELLKTGSLIGYQFVLWIIAYISLVLAIMNFLPIPALDGGRFWITLVSRSIKKPLSPKREELVNAVGLFVLVSLMILITIVDVKRSH